jgi:hypothetical protein
VAYVNGRKCGIPFANATASDDRDVSVLPTPFVVRFPAAVAFESAYVGTLAGLPCPVHQPAVAKDLQTYIKRYGTANVTALTGGSNKNRTFGCGSYSFDQ